MSGRATVYQVGGAGDIAGGLSQVVRSLCTWQFEHVDTVALPTRSRGSLMRTSVALGAAMVTILRRRSRRQSTVVAVHVSQGGSFVREGAVVLGAHAAGLPVVIHVHGSAFAVFARDRPRIAGVVLRRADAVLVLSEETATAVRSVAPSVPVIDVPNAVVVPEPESKADVVVFAGAVCHRKGVDVLLDAWSSVGADAHEWKLVLAGPVEMDLEPWAGLRNVTVCGAVDHDALLEVMARARVVVLPSRAEALPLALLEGMAAGCAVVSTEVGSIARLLRGGAGIVVPAGHLEALRTALHELLVDDALVDRLGAAGRRRVHEDYSAGAVFPRVESVWLRALSQRNGARRRPMDTIL